VTLLVSIYINSGDVIGE